MTGLQGESLIAVHHQMQHSAGLSCDTVYSYSAVDFDRNAAGAATDRGDALEWAPPSSPSFTAAPSIAFYTSLTVLYGTQPHCFSASVLLELQFPREECQD